jgi:hypothetical protein
MLNLKTFAQWAVLTIATLSMGLEPLAAGATSLPSASAKVTGSTMLIARSAERRSGTTHRPSKPKKQQRVLSNKPSRSGVSASAAEVEKFQSVYLAGMNVIPGCITRHNSRACSQLVESKSALTNWCLQGKTEACMMLKTLSSQEAYETMSDALQQSVQ